MTRLFQRATRRGTLGASAQDQVYRRWRKDLYVAAGIGVFITFTQLSYLSRLATAPPGADGGDAITASIFVTLALSGAFWAILELRAREAAVRTRGRVIREQGQPRGKETLQRLTAGVGLALLTLVGALGLMALFEAAAAGVAGQLKQERAVAARSPGELALEEARRVAQRVAADAESSGSRGSATPDGSGAAAVSAGLVGPGRRTDSSEEGRDAVRVGNLISDEPVMLVRSRTPLPKSSVHLRGLVLDEYDASGTLQERSAGRGVTLQADADGWAAVEGEAGPQGPEDTGSGTLVELELEFPGPTNGVVYAPLRLRAVRAPEVLYAPDSELYVVQSDDVSSFAFRSVLPALDLDALRSATARGSLEGRSPGGPGPASSGRRGRGSTGTELPRAAPGSDRAYALKSLSSYAAALTAGATSDFDRVVRVVDHLRNTFGYELFDASLFSPERCEELIRSGAGSCTHFASLAALLLRSQGIPTRMAVGYVAREPLPAQLGPGWLVRARDGHAWIEVHFKEYGWLYLDPTPGDATAGGAATGWAPLSERSLARLEAERGRGRRGPRTSSLGDWVLRAIGQAWAAGQAALDLVGVRLLGVEEGGGGRSPAGSRWRLGLLLSGIAVAVGLGWVSWRKRRRARGSPVAARADEGQEPGGATSVRSQPPTEPGAREDWEAARALMQGLAASGHQQRRKETPSSFARRVEAEAAEARGLLGALRALMARSSQGRRLSAAEVEGVRRVAEELSARGGAGSPAGAASASAPPFQPAARTQPTPEAPSVPYRDDV